jgi:hypothetical protein
MFYVCEIIQLFPVVFCVGRAVNKFDFRHFIHEHLTNGDQWKEGNGVVETQRFDRICMFFSLTVLGSVKGLYSSCAGQLHSLE